MVERPLCAALEIKPLVRDALMAVGREAERDFRERLAPVGRELDGRVMER